VLVVEVDAVGAQPHQGTFDRGSDIRRAAVEHSRATGGMRDEAELRRHDDTIATPVSVLCGSR